MERIVGCLYTFQMYISQNSLGKHDTNKVLFLQLAQVSKIGLGAAFG